MGVFDEGCMGMFNAIIPDELLHPTGVFKERLSQSALYYETTQVERRRSARRASTGWSERGMKFVTGPNDDDRPDRRADSASSARCTSPPCASPTTSAAHTIGIQYQQGLKDLLPASDLVEGTLNNTDRPPVRSRDGERVLYEGEPLPHFNEVDECAGLDGLDHLSRAQARWASRSRTRCTICAGAIATTPARSTTTSGCF